MKSVLTVIFSVALLLTGCKTVGGSSDLRAWSMNGDEQAAKQFIMDTVSHYYSDAAATDALGAFAKALLDEKTSQSESADYVLQEYYELSKNAVGDDNPLQQYILTQFVILTNYLAFHADPSRTRLQFTGSQIKQAKRGN